MTRKLRPGQPPPVLCLPKVGGGVFDVNAEKINRFLLIDVYRGLHCPRCHLHLLDLNSKIAHLERRGVSAIAVSTDDEARASKARDQWGLRNLDVAYDMSLADVNNWDLFASSPISESEPLQPFAEPAMFLIAPDRTIYSMIVCSNPFNRYHFADVLESIDTVIARDYPPRGTFDGFVRQNRLDAGRAVS